MGVQSTSRGFIPTRNTVGHLCDHALTEGASHPCVCDRTRNHVALHLLDGIPEDQVPLF